MTRGGAVVSMGDEGGGGDEGGAAVKRGDEGVGTHLTFGDQTCFG